MDGCRIGFARVAITPDEAGGTLGWGSLGNRAAIPPRDPTEQLHATALALEDPTGQRVVLVNADVHCGSPALWEAAAARARVEPSRVVVCGTHTHEGPGQRYGGAMYTLFGNASPRRVGRSTRRLGSLVADAVEDAVAALVPGGVAVGRAVALDVASNRALPAWKHYGDGDREAFLTDGPGALVPDQAAIADRCRDPRLTVLVAQPDDGARRCLLAWFAVHGTALGAGWPNFSADLWGFARAEVERDAPSTVVGFGGGASGDISPLPLDEDGAIRAAADGRPSTQGRELAAAVGTRLGRTVLEAAASATPAGFTLGVAHERWAARSSGLPAPLSGMATAGGGIDGMTDLWPDVEAGVEAPRYRARRGRARSMDDPQGPKASIAAAYTGVPLPLGPAFRVLAPRRLPLHVLRVGDHAFATVPGEPTTMAAWRIERQVQQASGVGSASVIGFAGDYGGYWVTPEEYLQQRYEAASTIYGREATARLTERLVALAAEVHPGS